MGTAKSQPRRYTVEEYFALEAASGVRHEFFEGEVFAMAGESKAHNLITGNLYLGLRLALRGRGCQVFMENVQLTVRQEQQYVYPDVQVTCSPQDAQQTRRVEAPVLLVEVLSPSTAYYDRGHKFKKYKTLPSLQHYLLVAQNRWLVEWYRRTASNEWTHTVLTEPTEEIVVPELNFRLTLAQVYEDTEVAPLRPHFPDPADDAE